MWKLKTTEDVDKITNLVHQNIIEFHNYEYSRHVESYKKYIWDVRERATKIKGWQMNVSYPLTAMMVDTIFSTVFDFDYQLKLKSENLTRACIDAFDYKWRWKKILWLVTKEWIITGQWVMRDFIYNKENNYTILDEEISVVEKSPTIEYVSVFNIMYDRLRWLEDSDYVIIRQFLSIDDIIKKSWLSSEKKDWWISDAEKARNKIEKLKWPNNAAFSYLNYEAIKWLLFSHKFADMVEKWNKDKNKNYTTSLQYVDKNWLNENLCSDWEKNMLLNSPYLNDFDMKNELVEVIIWQDKHVFVNWIYIYTQEMMQWMFNIVSCKYNEMPWAWTSLWMSDILWKMQDTVTWMLNMFLDSLKLSNTMMFNQDWVLNKNKSAKIDIENWKILTWNIRRIDLWWSDFSSMNWIQALQWIAQSLTWVSQMIIWWDARVQRIAWAFDFAFAQYKSRLTPFTDSIDQAMSKVVKWWVLQYLNYYSKEELEELYGINVEKITEKWTVTDMLIDWTSIKEIINENNISFKFDSMFNLKKESQKQIIMDVVQILEQYKKGWENKVNVDALWRMLAWDMDITPEDVLNIYPDKWNKWTEDVEDLINIEEWEEWTIEDVEEIIWQDLANVEWGVQWEINTGNEARNLIDNLL